MAELELGALVRSGVARSLVGDSHVKVRGVKHDSRRVEAGDLFVAIPAGHGNMRDGAGFVNDALARGAVAVLAQSALDTKVPVLVADDALIALAKVSALLCDDPTQKMEAVGITGTNGKTTTAYLVESMLAAAGKRPAVIGTVNFRGPFGTLPATHTTPMADDLMRIAKLAVDSGATHLVLEVSSHALAMHRADGVHFRVAAFTNLTQDHLDYHGTFASYEASKRRLFTELAPAASVVNVDDAAGVRFAAVARGRVLRCSKRVDAAAEVHALTFSSGRKGITARVATPAGELALQSPLIGEHNVENLLVAVGCGVALGLSPQVMAHALATAQGAPGRLERVAHPEDVLVFVDYAHTPDALSRVLTTLRGSTKGRLLVVFGCGGDRDPGKRPLMGRASAEIADLAVVTSDNPRSEQPDAIIAQIEQGVRAGGMPRVEPAALRGSARGYVVESDRRAAIKLALAVAQPGDSVLIAGKGHEKVQIIGDKQLPFDDCAVAREAIASLKGAA
jgi:UDP-N-acetylmuramoyl-L-alanyl-D-glutamate--2,6-diaminopimelate ligase